MADHIGPWSGQPATHPLAISNGYSTHWSRETGQEIPTVWCGHCKAFVDVTEEWAERYFDRHRQRLEARIAAGHVSPRNAEYARQELDKEQARVLDMLAIKDGA